MRAAWHAPHPNLNASFFMKKLIPLLSIFGILAAASISYSFIPHTPTKEEVKWYTWEEAVALTEKNPKKMFIDVYTDWCGWCKRMDKTTFGDAKVAAYLNENYYPVKLDAEMKQDVVYKGHTFKYIPSGRRGVHTLAASLLDNRLSYPSCVAMSEEMHRITIIPGYRDAAGMMQILEFIGEEHYKRMTFDDFVANQKK